MNYLFRIIGQLPVFGYSLNDVYIVSLTLCKQPVLPCLLTRLSLKCLLCSPCPYLVATSDDGAIPSPLLVVSHLRCNLVVTIAFFVYLHFYDTTFISLLVSTLFFEKKLTRVSTRAITGEGKKLIGNYLGT